MEDLEKSQRAKTRGSKRLIRILVVDDDVTFGKNFAAILEDKGYTATLVDSGNAAITELGGAHFDLAFVDIKLPDINGVEVLRKIKEVSPKTRVVVITAFPLDKLLMEAVEQGAFDYFCKPFDVNAVLQVVKDLSSPKR